ncbi:FMN-binding glutamate synthase family protein [Lutibacter sp.]|uniref:FMN-binding glutamate synthase family protein n=1 Tax=Lutibacter sp. TaxID=1925666 RepID=UPI0025B7B5D1|nr:FMN-binding glutamate synthase family protein [Lutibacter sp.]MCF6181401.1 FMN-binding glutamate synthase family protein [Lutibacter sp.]
MKVRKTFITISIITLVIIGLISISWKPILWSLVLFGPLIFIGISDILQKKHTIKRNFPVIGRGRYLLEKIRPEIMQYFVETDIEGRPINRMFRNLVYQRAKKANDTVPFGTQMDVYREGYEWLDHSMYACNDNDKNAHPRVNVGNPDCKKPYNASLLNISAMSFGSLSKNAVLALNKGAKEGNFAHNTGEGGISPYHLKHGGDLIWQIGTGYFGCRTHDGKFCVDTFTKKATLPNVKMIEIKISQGAKPGHGGILPAIKNTEEIAEIRDVPAHTDVNSPPSHSAFTSPTELMNFIKLLRDKSGGKPIGFKLCVGKKEEFIDLCKAMVSTGIKPDFITVDGGEGGTGAAPVEFSNSLGMPLRDGLAFVTDTLMGFDLKKDIKIIASGKIFSAFHIARIIALGADMVNSARAMMLAIGCIQARECNNNTCPVGVATQNKSLMKGLDVEDKSIRVANFHQETLLSFSELIAATGVANPSHLKRHHINRRINMNTVLKYDDIFPYTEVGSLLFSTNN